MKKLHYSIICVLSALTLAACQDDLTQVDDNGLTESTPLIVRGSLAGGTDSRTSYTVGESSISCAWDEGDQIALVSERTTTPVVYAATTDGTDTEFEAVSAGVAAADGEMAYAYYPIVDDGGSYSGVTLPTLCDQSYSGESFVPSTFDFIYSSATATDGVLEFSFSHLFAFLHVNIATNAMAGYAGLVVTSTDDIAYDSGATYDLTTNTLTATPTSSIIYWIDEESLAAAGDDIDCYIALWPTSSESTVTVSLLCTDGTTGAELYQKTSPSTGFAAGRLYETSISAFDIERYALIALYNATDGDNWTTNTNWCSDEDVSSWYGVTTNDEGYVTSISLYNNNLTGELPEEIGNLTNLTYIRTAMNGNLTGEIPESIGNLTNLTTLYMQTCSLTGSIPESIGNLTNLRYLYLNSNDLSGEIPESIGNLTDLYYLYLYSNDLSGEIPESIGNLTKLTYLSLYNNDLSGEIPESIGNLTDLYYLYLYSNDLSGEIPESIGNLTKLTYLYLYGNELSGEIPESIGNLSSLRYLYLYNNNLTGNLPVSIADLTKLTRFRVCGNRLSGEIPSEITETSWWQNMSISDIAMYILGQQVGYGLTLPYEWKKYGTGTYTYSSYWSALDSEELTLYQCTTDDTLFKIADWGANDIDLLFTWEDETVTVPTQATGELLLRNGTYYNLVIMAKGTSSHSEGTFTFKIQYVGSNNGGYSYVVTSYTGTETFVLDDDE